MKAYKGFYKSKYGRIYCQPCGADRLFYYEEGKTYECGNAILGKVGFHSCCLPIDVFNYYNSDYDMVEFHEVEIENIYGKSKYDSNVAGTKITIGRQITPDEMVDISIKMIMENKEKYFKNDELYLICKDNEYNFLKLDSTLLFEQWLDFAGHFHNGLASVKLNGKCNFIKPDGSILLNKWYDYVSYFENGFAKVELNEKWNFIKLDGTLLWDKPVEQWFDNIWDFHDGVASVKLNGIWHTLNKKGKIN